ncbi:hypothetical protein IBX73_06505 [candidate division WOR-3 bacterium]|nr:hypothetical protein [candidate division WOR-3 bacterium]
MNFKQISRLPEFDRDMKKLGKKFVTLEDDLTVFISTQLHLYHKLKIDNKGIHRIKDLKTDDPAVFKARKFACRSLKGRGVHSGIRIIYAYHAASDRVEFIEIYYKGSKKSGNRARILTYLSGCTGTP